MREPVTLEMNGVLVRFLVEQARDGYVYFTIETTISIDGVVLPQLRGCAMSAVDIQRLIDCLEQELARFDEDDGAADGPESPCEFAAYDANFTIRLAGDGTCALQLSFDGRSRPNITVEGDVEYEMLARFRDGCVLLTNLAAGGPPAPG